MRVSEAWLRECVNPPLAVEALADQLSMAGLEVDAVEPVAPMFTGVVIGQVLEVSPHPDATKLRVCRVDAGEDEPLQIVCGAPNVAADQRVPVALVGALLPGGHKLKKAKLRGVASQGMICSAAELGLAEQSDGIMVLPADAPVGEDLRDWLALDDHAIELDLTPDRSDCLSLAGVAREVGVLNRLPINLHPPEPVRATHSQRYPVELEAPAACPRYLCRVIRGVKVDAETPLWMVERLRRSGLRAISPVVDVTNYVLLELGQPLHAFDLATLDGPVSVRFSEAGERLSLLNDEQVVLDGDTLVIADARGPVAMAGIMGGAPTSVSDATQDILLESAFFAPEAIVGRARRYGLHTDASHRFERGVDPMLQQHAIERATKLLLEMCGGDPGPVVEACASEHLPHPATLLLRKPRIRQVLGIAPEDERVVDILQRLGMRLEHADRGWRVRVPSWRFDLQREVDLIGEIGRVYGYQAIPVSHARSAALTRAPREMAFSLDLARRSLVARGYYEAITYSFISPELSALFAGDPALRPLQLANPLSAELSVMRGSLWPGLLQALQQNLARQQARARLFETGLTFRQGAKALEQAPYLSAVAVGPVVAEQWGEPRRPTDFFDVKGDLEALLMQTGRLETLCFEAPSESDAHPALHPGQSARLVMDGRVLGWVGTLHPGLAQRLEVPSDTQLFELDLNALGLGARPIYAPLSRFPSIRRDLAILVDAELPFARVREVVTEAAGELLKQIVLFDLYQGDKVDAGRKSVAFGLILQASSQTLVDEEVDAVVRSVVARLEQDLGATLRQ